MTGNNFFFDLRYSFIFFARLGLTVSAFLIAVLNNEASRPAKRANEYNIRCDFPLPYDPVKIRALSVDLFSVLANKSSIICNELHEGI